MSAPPARGARSGVKQDLQRLKDAGAGFEAGPGTTAWSHDFLNKKPWHPLNFRNQIKFYEAEQEVLAREKREAASKAEFEAEQQYLETLAHLPSKEADKYRAMQGVSWMYIRPPGMAEAGEDPGGTPASDKPSASVPHATPDGGTAPQEGHPMPARAFRPKTEEERGQGTTNALTTSLKRRQGSPPIGGFSWQDNNQRMILDDDATMDPLRMLQDPGALTGNGSSEMIGTSGLASEQKHRHSRKHKHKSKASKSHKDHAHKHKHRCKHNNHIELEEGDKSSGDTPLRMSWSPHLKHAGGHGDRDWKRSRHGKRHHIVAKSTEETEGGVRVHEDEDHNRRRRKMRRHERVENALQFLIEQEVDVEALLQDKGR